MLIQAPDCIHGLFDKIQKDGSHVMLHLKMSSPVIRAVIMIVPDPNDANSLFFSHLSVIRRKIGQIHLFIYEIKRNEIILIDPVFDQRVLSI
jgi:hypothetical protein